MVRVHKGESITAPMSPREFVRKWGRDAAASRLNERAGAQQHFLDLCRLLAVAQPADPDSYCFERSFHQHNKSIGWADVWKRGCFAWEFKRPGVSLSAALDQLMRYALPLENPPLLVVSDRRRFEVHTHFTGHASERIVVLHEDLLQAESRATLRAVFESPYGFRPDRTSVDITRDAAQEFAAVAERMQSRGVDPKRAAHFLTQCLFCLFAQDVGLLKANLLKELTDNRQDPVGLRRGLGRLFKVMRTGGDFGVENIPWFNGGLFQAIDVPELDSSDVEALRNAARLDWRGLDPSIFGTLFERGLDPGKRRQLGAHYTDPATISKLVLPVIERPLLTEWSEVREKIANLLCNGKTGEYAPQVNPREERSRARRSDRMAQDLFNTFLERLREFRVLDPACGSGNFLYVALRALKDIEHLVSSEAESLGLHRQLPVTGPQNLLGIEVNSYAAELSRVTVWIGELQWRLRHGFGWKLNPILDPLDQIECRDALITDSGEVAPWPSADVLIGNPPFVGDKRMRADLGAGYTDMLRAAFKGKVAGGSDLVCYWFERAKSQIEARHLSRAGLVATNSIRGGRNREVLDQIVQGGRIFEAWSDEPWVNEGASVRVSLVAFGDSPQISMLDGVVVAEIAPSLQAANVSLHATSVQPESAIASFQGPVKVGPFDVPGSLAREWLQKPNPHGVSNAKVLRPLVNGLDLTRRPTDSWIVDFGGAMTEAEAALFEAPFAHVREHVKPMRLTQRRLARARLWWLHGETVPGLRREMAGISRYAVTPRVAKYRTWSWRSAASLPDSAVVAVTRSDDATFGILHSRFHEVWSLSAGSSLEDRPRYTPSTCFDAFPFPSGLTPRDTAHQKVEEVERCMLPADLNPEVRIKAFQIGMAACRLVELRDAWLNPPEWVDKVPEDVPLGMKASSYPDRLIAKQGYEDVLRSRTLTNLYNERPSWLSMAHEVLDQAVAAAYGWTDYTPLMSDEDILRRLRALNSDRAAADTMRQGELPLLANVAHGQQPKKRVPKPGLVGVTASRGRTKSA